MYIIVLTLCSYALHAVSTATGTAENPVAANPYDYPSPTFSDLKKKEESEVSGI